MYCICGDLFCCQTWSVLGCYICGDLLLCVLFSGVEKLVVLGVADILGWGSRDVQCSRHTPPSDTLSLRIL